MTAAVQKKGGSSSLWLASNPSKRWAEVFFLAYSPFWILWALCILVPFQLYEVGADSHGWWCVVLENAAASTAAPLQSCHMPGWQLIGDSSTYVAVFDKATLPQLFKHCLIQLGWDALGLYCWCCSTVMSGAT